MLGINMLGRLGTWWDMIKSWWVGGWAREGGSSSSWCMWRCVCVQGGGGVEPDVSWRVCGYVWVEGEGEMVSDVPTNGTPVPLVCIP